MLNSKVFRLFWRDNLRSTRRRSASCPNLENLSQESEIQGKNSDNNAFVSTSESESDDDASKKFVERLKVQQSIRKVHRKEKEKKENAEKKFISMDDYLGKLSELKTWLKEEQKKDVDNIKSPKLKTHFKTFVKLWNKRKLPLKYYKSCSVDLNNDDSPSSPSYSQQPINYHCSPFEESAKFSTSILHTPFNLPGEEKLNNVGSLFSTFGKCDLLSIPTFLTDQDTNASKCIKKRGDNTKGSSPHKHNKYNNDQSSQGSSPPKFATISRAIPASSLYKFTAQPWSSGENIKTRPVLAPKCPDPHNHFPVSSFSSSPAVIRICSHSITEGENAVKTDAPHQTSVFTKPPGPSPVYSTTIDAIPYNTGSPKYAEIDESICSTPQKLPSSGYCSISPLQNWKPVHADIKQSVSKKQSFSRRRSKSMEDIYSLPFKAGSLGKISDFTDKEYTESLDMPPIPERKYSPEALSSKCLNQTNKETPMHNTFDDYSRCYTSPSKDSRSIWMETSLSKVALSPVCSPPESSMYKRQSQEGVESIHDTSSSLKKAKPAVSSNLNMVTDPNETLVLNTSESENVSTPVLSILTGSLNPTTRSKYKMDGSVQSPETNIGNNSENSEPRLSMIQIQQLDGSPKLPRRRLKRRSSSLSTTPGKGLTFGKASKMSSPRRVSFAKNVKEAENKVTPAKSSPARHTVVQTFTTQTMDRRKFESFLSSHENLPKSKASSPEKKSPPKTSSPDKRSPQKFMDNNETLISRIYHERHDNKIKKDLFASKNDGGRSEVNQKVYFKVSTSSLADVGKDGTPPLSSNRQVGRRVLGAPKASPNKIVTASEDIGEDYNYLQTSSGSLADTLNVGTSPLSWTRQVGRRVIGAPRVSPGENFPDGTEAYSTKKVQNAAHFSSRKCSPPVLSPQKHMEVSACSFSPRKVLQSSPEKNSKSSLQLSPSHSILSQKNVERSLSSRDSNLSRQLSPHSILSQKNVERSSSSQDSNASRQLSPSHSILSQKNVERSLSSRGSSSSHQLSPSHSILSQKNVERSLSSHDSDSSRQLSPSHSILSQKNVERSLSSRASNSSRQLSPHSILSQKNVERSSSSHDSNASRQLSPSHSILSQKNVERSLSSRGSNSSHQLSPSHSILSQKNVERSLSSHDSNSSRQLSPSHSILSQKNVERSLSSHDSNSSRQLSPHSILSQKNVEWSSSSCDSNSSLQRLSSQKHTSPRGQIRPQTNLSPLKDGTSELKHYSETKRLFDLPSMSTPKKSINALVSKLTEKTSTICARELSESDDCLSSDEAFYVPTSQLDTPESLIIIPDSIKMSPGLSSPSDELHKENEDFIITTLESSPGDKAKEVSDCITNASVTSCADILSVERADPDLDHISKTTANKTVNPPFVSDAVDISSLQTFDGVSSKLPVEELYRLNYEKIDSTSNEAQHIPQLNNSYGYRRVKEAVVSQCFTLPVNYMTLDHKTTCSPKVYHAEDKVPSQTGDSGLSNLTSAGAVKKDYKKNFACIPEKEVSQINYKVIEANHTDKSSLELVSVNSSADDNTNIRSTSTGKNEYECDLKRLASIRASPKVVENDSWVTERRRSSRGKRQQSFRSAYNKHLLSTSCKECEEAEIDQTSASESLNVTPDFLDSSVRADKSLEITDNAQGTLPANASEIVSKDMTLDKQGHRHLNLINDTTENSSASSPAKVKPATLPKPRASMLARRNLNTANKSTINTGKTTSKRHSSIIKPETITATPSRLEKSTIVHENRRARLSTKLDKPRESLSTGQGKVSRRVSSGKKKMSSRKSNEQGKCQEPSKQKSSEEESSVLVEDIGQRRLKDLQKVVSNEQGSSRPQAHSIRKVSSTMAAGRRRSKNRSIGEENKVPSFAEKMKFFNQLRVNDVKTQTNRAFNTSSQVRWSPQKQNQTVETSVKATSKNSEPVSLHKTQRILLAGQDKHSTEIL